MAPPRSLAQVAPDGQPPATGSGVYPKGTQNPNSLVSGDWCRARRSGPWGLFKNTENRSLLEPPGPGVRGGGASVCTQWGGRVRQQQDMWGWGQTALCPQQRDEQRQGFADSHEQKWGPCRRRGCLGLATQGLPVLPQGARLKGLCPVQPPHLSRPLGSVTRAWLASAILPAAPLK